jgi:hypothetical protein
LTEYGYAVETQSDAPEPQKIEPPPPVKKPASVPSAVAKKPPPPPSAPSPPPGTITLEPEEAEFILRFVSGQTVGKNKVLQERIKAKIMAEAARIAKRNQ